MLFDFLRSVSLFSCVIKHESYHCNGIQEEIARVHGLVD